MANRIYDTQWQKNDGEIDQRDVRALTEVMSVLDDQDPRVRGAGDMFLVVSHSGNEYIVDLRERSCTCPDFEHNLPTDDGRHSCKHIARCTYEAGRRPIPGSINRDAIDEQLGMHVSSVPRVSPEVVAADGGGAGGGESDGDGEQGGHDADEKEDGYAPSTLSDRLAADGPDPDALLASAADASSRGPEVIDSDDADGGADADGDAQPDTGRVDEPEPEPDRDRPTDCTCVAPRDRSDSRDIPCFQCWKAGFRTTNPGVKAPRSGDRDG